MALDNPPQLYVIFTGGDLDHATRQVFGPYHDASFRNLPKSEIIDLWVRQFADLPVDSPLATRINGVWKLHDGTAESQCNWHWVAIKQMKPEQARQIDKTERGYHAGSAADSGNR